MLEKLFGIREKVALVVGASRGLGKSMALALAAAGANVSVASRSKTLIEETRDEISALGRKSLAIETDVTREEDISRMVDQMINEFKKIDILVNCAGFFASAKVLKTTVEDWDKTFNTNLKGIFLTCKLVGKYMAEQKSGKMINITSILGKRAALRSCAYGSSKAAIIQLTRVLALEFAPYNINVNAIGPGFFETEMTKEELGNPQPRKFLLERIPFGRFGEPQDLEGTVIFLASKASDFMTGETIFIDGGMGMSL
jgi:2-dehydro-3-deoxy-D-gluconate 5-dehydrogenase